MTCEFCKYRDKDGICQNTDKIFEDWGQEPPLDDCLIYPYNEGGNFYVGKNFGCIHWEEKP